MKKPLKAFILAGGFGTRLRPLTDSCPKPLLPFFGVPLLYLLLEKLVPLNVEEIFVNGHYLSEQIRTAIEVYSLPIKVTFCPEHPQILGTAGAIGAVKQHLGDCDLIILNGDIVTDFKLIDLVNKHQKTSALATMGLLKNVPPSKTSLWCDNDLILAIDGPSPSPKLPLKEHTFSGIQVLSSDFIKEIASSGPSEIIPIYQNFIKNEKYISYQVQDPFWFDIGSPEMYFEAHKKALGFLKDKEKIDSFYLPIAWKKLGIDPFILDSETILVDDGKRWTGPLFSKKRRKLGANSSFGPTVIDLTDYDSFPENIRVLNSILLGGAKIGSGETIQGILVSKDFRLNVCD